MTLRTLGGPSTATLGTTYAALPKVAATVSASGAAVVNQHNPVNASGAARSLSLPTGQAEGTQISVEKVDTSTNLVNVTGNIRGVGSSTLPLAWQYESILLRADSAGSWWPVAGHKTKTSMDNAYGGRLVFTDSRVGGVGDDATDNASALNAACTLLGSRGGEIFFPPGVYRFTTQPAIIPSNIRLVGAGKNASILRKTGNFDFLRFVGSSTSSRCQRGGAANIQLNGNTTTTGRLVMATYADHLNFDNVWFAYNADTAFIGTELWDTYFKGCEFEWTSGTDGLKPALLLQSSATDSTNEVYFEQCRWESNKDGDVWIATGGISSAYTVTTGSHPVYGVYFTDCKVECAFLRGPRIAYSADVFDVHWDRLYLAADGLDTGIGSGRNLVEFTASAFTTFSQVHVFINGSAAARVFRVFPGAYGHAIRDVYVDAQTAPTTAVFDFAGGNPYMKVSNVRFKSGQSGTLYTGSSTGNVILDDQPTVKINTQTASYTLVLTDADTVVEENSASATNVTVPPNSSVAFPIGTVIEVHQYAAGQVTLVAGAGVTIRTSSSLTTRAQYSTVTLRKRATDEWVAAGDLS